MSFKRTILVACAAAFVAVFSSAGIAHKSDAGAVVLDLATAYDVRSAYARITANLARHGFSGALDGMSLSPPTPSKEN